MELGNDLRYAWRQLRRSPGFALAVCFALSHLATSMLYGVDTHNILLVIEIVTAVLAITCITASYLPARRAAHIDPIEALRHE